LKLSCALAEACPGANAVFGKPDFSKVSSLCVCGVCFSPGCKSLNCMQPFS